jgi:hypothetical protein
MRIGIFSRQDVKALLMESVKPFWIIMQKVLWNMYNISIKNTYILKNPHHPLLPQTDVVFGTKTPVK